MRIVFLGTAGFACPALEGLAVRHGLALVVTQPDRPAGRGGKLRRPPVKSSAEELGLSVIQPERINAPEIVERLIDVAPDAIVVAAYGQILRPRVFGIPPLGTINIHASLLPAYRGAAPVQWAIVRGERTTGITTFLIDAGMDTGEALLRRELPIGPDETALELERRLAELGASAILETLDGIEAGSLVPIPQPEEGVSYAPMLTRDAGRIDWALSASAVHDLVRGTVPWPGAWTTLGSERVKVHRSARTGISSGRIPPGGIAPAETERLLVGCGDGLIELLEVQREGRPRVEGCAFLHGLREADRFV